jgi:uncharacterized membrane protein YdjX (TVP38/TMEM64 family)
MNRNNSKKPSGRKAGSLVWLAITAILFISISYFIQTNKELFTGWIVNGILGMISYILLHITAIVIAPFSAFPLISLATGIWGWKIAALLTFIGWLLGSTFAFLIARKWGVPFVSKFISLKKVHHLQESLSETAGFWNILFLRILLPGDYLSYALGLFTPISFRTYILATTIGLLPFAIGYSYLGTFNILYQGIFMAIIVAIFAVFIIFKKGLFKKND